MKKIIKVYKCRIYPNKKQTLKFERDLNAHLFAYNKLLEQYQKDYRTNMKNHKKQIYGKKYFYTTLQQLKEEYPHLKQINQTILKESYHTLINTITQYKKGLTKKPQKLTPDKSSQTFKLINNNNSKITQNKLHLKGYGTFKLHDKRTIKGKIKQFIIKKQNNQWFILIKCTQVPMTEYKKTNKAIGIDLGIMNLMILSDGTTIKPPDLTQAEEKINKRTRKISKKEKDGANFTKNRIQIQAAHIHRNNIINDYLHKISTKIVQEYDVIVMETLNIHKLIQNRKYSHSIFNMNWNKLKRLIEYKANLNNKTFIQVPAKYPSTKLCHNCGYKNNNLTIEMREWTCPKCDMHHDRDVNAAVNILKKGLAMKE